MAFINNGTIYMDVGCRLHPSCLNCPEPDCIAGYNHGIRTTGGRHLDFIAERKKHSIELWLSGVGYYEIGSRLGIRPSTVQRYLTEYRRGLKANG